VLFVLLARCSDYFLARTSQFVHRVPLHSSKLQTVTALVIERAILRSCLSNTNVSFASCSLCSHRLFSSCFGSCSCGSGSCSGCSGQFQWRS
jgi:hypothetical protein